MSKSTAPVLLRDLDANGKTKPFAPEHAERLLAYPNTRWAKVEESDSTEKKSKAVAAKDAPAAGSPTPDAGNPAGS